MGLSPCTVCVTAESIMGKDRCFHNTAVYFLEVEVHLHLSHYCIVHMIYHGLVSKGCIVYLYFSEVARRRDTTADGKWSANFKLAF